MDEAALSSWPKQLTVTTAVADLSGHGIPPSPAELTNNHLSQQAVTTLSQAWKEARRRFLETTGQRLDDTAVDLEKFTQTWAERSEEALHDKATAKKYKMLNIFSNIANGLCLLGELVASGAQVAVGFAGPCISALSFVLQTPQRISEVYDSIMDLYEEIENFLVRFKILNRIDRGKGLPVEIIKYASEMLINFVDISGLVYKVLKQTKRTILAAAFLRDDRGISDSLANFRTMAQKLDRVIHTVNLEGIYEMRELGRDTYVGVKQILRSVEQRSISEKTKQINQSRLTTIRSKIYAEGERNLAEKPLEIPDLLPQTLDCLKDDESFRHWRDDPVEFNRAQLLLSGPSRSGKSYLMKALQLSLLETRDDAEESGTSIYVAYHDFTSDSSKKSSSRIPFALRNMAMQVAEQSTAYATVLEKELKGNSASSKSYNVKEVWNGLQLATFKQKAQQAKMYLLFDGIEVETQAHLTELINLLSRNRTGSQSMNDTLSIRAIFTVDPEKQQRNTHIATIDTDKVTAQLVRAYAIRELRTRDLFQSPDAKSSRHREKIMQAVDGMTIRKVEQKLELIQHEYHSNLTSRPIDQILQDETEQLLDQQSKVPSLNLTRRLTPDEVVEFRELLPWLLYSEYAGVLEVDELEAVLCLAHGHDSLQSLHTKIDGAYRELLYLDPADNFVRLKQDKENLLQKAASQVQTASGDESTSINLEITIKNANKSVIQQFLWQLNDNVSTNRFDFESYSRMNQEIIPTNETQSHLCITKMCLKLLNDGWEAETQILVRYARDWLPRHFVYLLGRLDVISVTDQTSISHDLVHFLRTPYQLSRDDDKHFGSGEEWLSNTEASQSIRVWLQRTKTRLDIRQRKWIDEALRPNKGCLSHMYDVARAVGKKWLRHQKEIAEERWPTYGIRTSNALESMLFQWLDLYIENNKLDQHDASSDGSLEHGPAKQLNAINPSTEEYNADPSQEESEESRSGPDYDRPRLARVNTVKELSLSDRIKRAVAWVEDHEVAYVTTGTANLNIGYTYMSYLEFDEAGEFFSRLMEKSSHRRQGLIALGRMSYAKEDLETAATRFQEALAVFEEQRGHDPGEKDSAQIQSELFCELATVYEKLPQPDQQKIISLYEKSLDYEDKMDNKWKLLRLFCQDKAPTSIGKVRDCFKKWSASANEDSESIIGQLIKRTAKEDPDCEQLELFIHAIRDDGLQSSVVTALRDLLAAEDTIMDPRTKSTLLYLQGLATMKGSGEERWAAAVELWEELIRLQDRNAESYWMYGDLQTKAAHVVAQYYLDVAVARAAGNAPQLRADDDKEIIFQCLVHDLNDKVFNGSVSPSQSTKEIVKRCLVSMNVVLGRDTEARRSTKEDMSTVIDILQDDDSDNDFQGVTTLINTMCSIGDKVGALTAFSLFDREAQRPTGDVTPESVNPGPPDIIVSNFRSCDGCRKILRSQDQEGFWLCQSCYDFDLCVNCYEEMTNNTASFPRCSATHHHIHVYHTDYAEEEKTGNKVMIDWEWEGTGNGKYNRKGGRLVPLSEWLEILRQKWDITEISKTSKVQK